MADQKDERDGTADRGEPEPEDATGSRRGEAGRAAEEGAEGAEAGEGEAGRAAAEEGAEGAEAGEGEAGRAAAEEGAEGAEAGEGEAAGEGSRDEEVAELEDEVEELEDEVRRLTDRLAELEAELAGFRKGSTSARWATWLFGTFAVCASLALVVIVLGHGLPTGEPAAEGAAGSVAQEEALNALVMEHADELQACLDAWASSSDAPDGTIVATAIDITAGEAGAVSRVRVTGTGLDETFASCLERAVSAWVFPGPGAYLLQAPFEVRRGAGSSGEPQADREPAGER